MKIVVESYPHVNKFKNTEKVPSKTTNLCVPYKHMYAKFTYCNIDHYREHG